MNEAEFNARIENAVKAGFVQSLNNLGYDEQTIKQAATVYPLLLEKRAYDRYNVVRNLILNAIHN